MKTNDKKFNKQRNIIFVSLMIGCLILIIILFGIWFTNNEALARETGFEVEDIKISNANIIDIENFINENSNNEETIELLQVEETLEYLTTYITNPKIPKGISYVVQEGREGRQIVTTQNVYRKGQLVSEEHIKTTITKSSSNKVIEIGGASYTNNYKVKVNDTVYVTSDVLEMRDEPNENSRKITTLTKDDELKVIEINQSWYKISHNNMVGYVKSECTTFINPNMDEKELIEQSTQKSKQQLISMLDYNMPLNKPSGLSLEQFKKVLTDSKDSKKIFKNNAEYFYYIEKQYNINGIFVASIGIHESGWGTSNIALQKNNLFGYGAYDSNPYNGAYEFVSYSESIDLLARVLVKYYLNPYGTSIYGGEKAVGTYYNGATLKGVNTRYASDKNWSNAVYTYIKYLYNKL